MPPATRLPRDAGRVWERVRGLKKKHLLLGRSSACSAEVIPTFDFLETQALPGSPRGWEKEGEKITTRKQQKKQATQRPGHAAVAVPKLSPAAHGAANLTCYVDVPLTGM